MLLFQPNSPIIQWTALYIFRYYYYFFSYLIQAELGLISYGCHNKWHTLGSLKLEKFIFSPFWRQKVHSQGVSGVLLPLKALMKWGCSWPLPAPGNSRRSLASPGCVPVNPTSSVVALPPPLHVSGPLLALHFSVSLCLSFSSLKSKQKCFQLWCKHVL